MSIESSIVLASMTKPEDGVLMISFELLKDLIKRVDEFKCDIVLRQAKDAFVVELVIRRIINITTCTVVCAETFELAYKYLPIIRGKINEYRKFN